MSDQNPEERFRPNKLNWEIVAADLGLSHLSKESQLDALMQYQRDQGLILVSDQPLSCMAQRCSSDVFVSEDSDGNQLVMASEYVFEVETNGDRISFGPLYLVDRAKVQFDKFIIDGIEMYPVTEDHIYLTTMTCEVDDLFVTKEELERFLIRGVDVKPPYADPSSEHYAPEMALVIELHKAIRINNEYSRFSNMEDKVHQWFRKNQPGKEIAPNRLKRFAAVIGDAKKIG